MIINTVQTAKAVEVGRFLKAKEKKNILPNPQAK
jgi:hypothetical protein